MSINEETKQMLKDLAAAARTVVDQLDPSDFRNTVADWGNINVRSTILIYDSGDEDVSVDLYNVKYDGNLELSRAVEKRVRAMGFPGTLVVTFPNE